MKTVFLDCSPKRKRSTSSYLLWHLKVLIGGNKVKMKLRPNNYQDILNELKDADKLVLATPTYVDGVPGSVLKFLEFLEANKLDKKIKVYAVSNCGFYEGHQNDNTLNILKNWCNRANYEYMGGIGYGAGEMIGIVRYFNVFLAFMILFIELLIGSIKMLVNSSFTLLGLVNSVNVISVLSNFIVLIIFNLFLYYYSVKVSYRIRNNIKFKKNIYTTVCCPRFLFVIFADLFWIIKAMLRKVPVWKLYNK